MDAEETAESEAFSAANSISPKIAKQMGKRGWTKESVEETINNPSRTVSTQDTRNLPGGGRMDDPATVYLDAEGSYIVKNDKTGDYCSSFQQKRSRLEIAL